MALLSGQLLALAIQDAGRLFRSETWMAGGAPPPGRYAATAIALTGYGAGLSAEEASRVRQVLAAGQAMATAGRLVGESLEGATYSGRAGSPGSVGLDLPEGEGPSLADIRGQARLPEGLLTVALRVTWVSGRGAVTTRTVEVETRPGQRVGDAARQVLARAVESFDWPGTWDVANAALAGPVVPFMPASWE